jgi:hypothetical protein
MMTPAGRFLVEGIVWRWDLSGVKTLNLTFVVRKSNDGASALLPSWRRHFGESTRGRSVVNGGGLLLRASDQFGGVYFLFLFFVFTF